MTRWPRWTRHVDPLGGARAARAAADAELAAELRAALSSGDDYVGNGKPQIDWDDRAAREELIDSRARDGFAVLALLDGRELAEPVAAGGGVAGHGAGPGPARPAPDGVFRIARRVAKDRVISTVDPEARHGHKTAARGFDGYKGHAAVDPDSEIITATTVTPGNAGDASVAEDLIADLLDDDRRRRPHEPSTGRARGEPQQPIAPQQPVEAERGCGRGRRAGVRLRRQRLRHRVRSTTGSTGRDRRPLQDPDTHRGGRVVQQGPVRHRPRRRHGELPGRDHRADPPGPRRRRHRLLRVGLRRSARCARSAPPPPAGARSSVGPYEQTLADARARQTDPAWVADYRATRPKVERKLGHLMRRQHGGRRARVRGTARVDADFRLLAGAVNLARLAVLGLRGTAQGWAVAA